VEILWPQLGFLVLYAAIVLRIAVRKLEGGKVA
jgi:hypothetical protein